MPQTSEGGIREGGKKGEGPYISIHIVYMRMDSAVFVHPHPTLFFTRDISCLIYLLHMSTARESQRVNCV